MNVRGIVGTVSVAVLLPCQSGCGGHKPGDTALGTYELERPPNLAVLSPVERETLQLNPNRTFSQEIALRGGKIFRGTGNWRAERIAERKVGGGVLVVGAVWVTLDGFLLIAGGEMIRVTNSFHEIHQVGTDALRSYEGTNRLQFRR